MSILFIADVHLGKLAKSLRLLGVDTLYSNEAAPQQMIAEAKQHSRILLSKSSSLTLELPDLSYTVLSSDPKEQLQQVIKHFDLLNLLKPFTRCLICNGLLHTVQKDSIISQLEPNTRKAFDEFWQCNNCKHIYWKGSHYERMLNAIEAIKY